MNKSMELYARTELKAQLKSCSEAQVKLFKRMYSHNNLELDIDTVVDNMQSDKLDHALSQVERTLNA